MTLWIEQLTAAEWTAKNPVLEEDVLGYESDTKKHKIGDGHTPWNLLGYVHNFIASVVYPVGSIYISVNPTNPSNFFGGTWVRFAKGRVLVGVNEADPYFDAVEEIGGSKYSTS